MWEIYVIHLLNFQEKSQETINVIGRALGFHSSYDQFYLHKGNVLIELGRKMKLLKYRTKYQIWILTDIRFKILQYYQGQLLLEANQLDEALKQFNIAIDVEEQYDAINNLLTSLFEYKYQYKYCDHIIIKRYQYINFQHAHYLKYNEALPLLEQVVKQENFYSSYAEQLIKKIEDIQKAQKDIDQKNDQV